MELVHYGSSEYKTRKFRTPVNRPGWNKPEGGLWASLADSEWSWKHWCQAEEFMTEYLDKSFSFGFKSTARVCKVDSFKDLESWPRQESPDWMKDLKSFPPAPDFQALAKTVDAIWLTVEGQQATRFGPSRGIAMGDLYGWDCECVLVLNKKIIDPKKK